MKTEAEVLERFHHALDMDPDPGAYDRLRASLADRAAAVGPSPSSHLALVASVAVALLVVVVLLVIRQSVAPAPVPAAPTEIVPPAAVTSIGDVEFLNKQTGWITDSGELGAGAALYRTDDAGRTWKRQLALGSNVIATHHFFDSRHGVVVVTSWLNPAQPGRLYETSDGGSTWVENGLPPGYDYFGWSSVSPSEGWLLGLQLVHPESQKPPLYRTTDGGATWSRLGPIDTPGQGALWLWFTDARHGGIEATALGHMPALLTSDDGGLSWHAINLAPPPGVDLAQRWVTILRPMFFGGGRGVLMVGISDPRTAGTITHLYMYPTTDQGAHWGRPLAAPAGQQQLGLSGSWSSGLWWFAQDHYVATSTDSGRSWQRRQVSLPAAFHLRTVEFVDPQHAWAVATDRSLQDVGGPRHEVMLVTEDGGAHWTQLAIPGPQHG